MAVVIAEILTEVVLAGPAVPGAAPPGSGVSDEVLDAVVRRATERVLEVLRREWDR